MLFNRIEHTEIIEVDELSLITLIANVGGILGLCFGISFLSSVELFELTFKVILEILRKSYMKFKRDRKINPDCNQESIEIKENIPRPKNKFLRNNSV